MAIEPVKGLDNELPFGLAASSNAVAVSAT